MTRSRKKKRWIAALGLLLWLGIPAEAHVGDRVYPIPYLAESGGGVAGEAPVIWVVELYVTPFDGWGEESWHGPAGSAVSRFSAGGVIGFTIIVYDWDPPDTEWIYWGLDFQQSDERTRTFDNVLRQRADAFLDGLLLPADPAGPEGSAVDAVSWGRIKASLEFE